MNAMIPPRELNNREFSRVVRGYSIPEVDEYITYLRDKYTDLYRENDALQRRLQEANAELDELKAEESDIRAALITAQKAGKKIITDANTRAGRITMQTKIDCDRILDSFRRESATERETLAVLKGQVANLKQRLFEMYSSHISMIEQITPNINEEISHISAISDDEYAASLAAEIRGKCGIDAEDEKAAVSNEELDALARTFEKTLTPETKPEQPEPEPPKDAAQTETEAAFPEIEIFSAVAEETPQPQAEEMAEPQPTPSPFREPDMQTPAEPAVEPAAEPAPAAYGVAEPAEALPDTAESKEMQPAATPATETGPEETKTAQAESGWAQFDGTQFEGADDGGKEADAATELLAYMRMRSAESPSPQEDLPAEETSADATVSWLKMETNAGTPAESVTPPTAEAPEETKETKEAQETQETQAETPDDQDRAENIFETLRLLNEKFLQQEQAGATADEAKAPEDFFTALKEDDPADTALPH